MSLAPPITWSRSRSQTLRYLTPCRSTLWSALTHQVRLLAHANQTVTFLYWLRNSFSFLFLKEIWVIFLYTVTNNKISYCTSQLYSCLQICPVPLLDHTGRNSTSSDLRSISKPHQYFLLTSFKSFSTRTQIYQSVSPSSVLLPFFSQLGWISVIWSLPLQCDPALLPEPNHVMLNHLYALSIKVNWHSGHTFSDVTGTL